MGLVVVLVEGLQAKKMTVVFRLSLLIGGNNFN